MKSLRPLVLTIMMTLAGTLSLGAQALTGYGFFAGLGRSAPGGSFIDFIGEVGGAVNPRYGISLGGFATFAVAPNTTARAELGLSQKGFRVPPDNGLRRRDLDLTYVHLAGLVQRTFPLETVSPRVAAGPVLSMLTSANGTIDDISADVSDEMSGTDLGFAVEAGVTREMLDVGIRYVMGLSNVSSSPDEDEGFKNRTLSLIVSYLIPR